MVGEEEEDDDEEHGDGKRVAVLYVISLVVGVTCWMLDRLFCEEISKLPFNPQGHAWWHVLMGINSFFGISFIQFLRAQSLHMSPRIEFVMGVPYVSLRKMA